jgi:hypothetical protein
VAAVPKASQTRIKKCKTSVLPLQETTEFRSLEDYLFELYLWTTGRDKKGIEERNETPKRNEI